jgi:hypothetical protein
LGGLRLEAHRIVEGEITRLDTAAKKVTASWQLAPCDAPTGLAIDSARRQLLTVCEDHKLDAVNAETGDAPVMLDCFAMPQGAVTLLIEKLECVAIDIEAIERLIASERLDTSDQLLALRTIQELYRRLADDIRVAISLFE